MQGDSRFPQKRLSVGQVLLVGILAATAGGVVGSRLGIAGRFGGVAGTIPLAIMFGIMGTLGAIVLEAPSSWTRSMMR